MCYVSTLESIRFLRCESEHWILYINYLCAVLLEVLCIDNMLINIVFVFTYFMNVEMDM